ncbi:MAG: hypothetical protein EZS28_015652, partial [Streblomastix strix]
MLRIKQIYSFATCPDVGADNFFRDLMMQYASAQIMGNFLIGNTQETSGTFYLTGFGLCKKIQNQECMASKLTNESSFRGSLK